MSIQSLKNYTQVDSGNPSKNECRKGYLLSVYYDRKHKKAKLKFYDPERKEIFTTLDESGHRPYLLTDASQFDIARTVPSDLYNRITRFKHVRKWDVLRERHIDLVKVEARDPLAIGGTGKNLRDLLSEAGFHVWEAKIKYYNCYIYDRNLIPGILYEIGPDGLKPIITVTPDELRIADRISKDSETREFLRSIISVFSSEAPELPATSIDIEVAAAPGTIPRVAEAIKPIITVAMENTNGERKIFLLGDDVDIENVEIKTYNSESELIKDVLKEISKFPIVFTYNGDNFDLPYLARRAAKFSIDPWPINIEADRTIIETGIHIDLYKLYSNHSIQVYVFKNRYLGFTLDDVSRAVLGEGKLELPSTNFNEISKRILAVYCLQDAHLTYKLGMALGGNLIKLLILFSRLSKLPLEDVSRRGISYWIQSMIYNEYRRRNWLIPNKEEIMRIKGSRTHTKAIIKGKKYLGAIVLEPIPGIHFDVWVMDFASLYPSVIKRWNVSFETINCQHAECRRNKPVMDLPYHICTYPGKGIIHRLIGGLRDLRVEWYKKMAKNKEVQPEKRRWYDLVQNSLKVMLNASYGVFGYENFPLYSPPVAEMITALGRKAMLIALEIARDLGLKVIYGDSLPYDRRIVVLERDGNIRLLEIGKLYELYSRKPYEVKTLALIDGKPVFAPIKRVIKHKYTGFLLEIKTNRGRTIVTPQHSVYAWIDGKIRLVNAENVKKGDALVSISTLPIKTQDRYHVEKFESLDKECLAWLLGLYYQRGAIKSNGKVVFKGVSEVEINFLERFLHSSLRKSNQYREDSRGTSVEVEAPEIISLIQRFYGHDRCIPWWIYRADNNVKVKFLEGMGYKIEEGAYIEVDEPRKAEEIGLLVKSLDLDDGHLYSVKFDWKHGKIGLRVCVNKKPYLPAIVEDIRQIRTVHPYVYDIEVEGAHNFVDAEGLILVHNTDSLFIANAENSDIEKFERIVEEKLGIDIEVDKHYRYVLLSSLKKNYLGVRDDGTVDIKGLLGKKRNIPELIRRAFTDVIDVLRKVDSIDDFVRAKQTILEILDSYIMRIRSGDYNIEDMAFRMILSKPLSQYVKTTPQHVKAAKMIEIYEGRKLMPGDIVEYVKTKGREGVKPLSQAKKEEIDVEKYLEMMRSTFEQILDVLNIDFSLLTDKRKQTGLLDFV